MYPQILTYAQEILRPGLTEIEFDSMLEQKARAVGHDGYSRVRSFGSEFHFGAVFSGARGALAGCFDGPIVGQGASIGFAQGPSNAMIQKEEPIILDFVTVVNGYQTDQTRLMALNGLVLSVMVWGWNWMNCP